MIPKDVKPQQSVHHGTDQTGQQHYLGGGHEEPHDRQDDMHLSNPGRLPTQHRDSTQKMLLLDNECFAEFKEWIKLNQMKYQLVPPKAKHC
jgi:hypothetical protein